MNTNTINVALCAKMFLAGAGNLEAKKEWINELNVFPVPDGDTGTNMTLTIMSAVKEVSALDSLTMESFARAVSSGSLRGARGNSGVILSQLLRGFTKVIRTEQEITTVVLTAALQKAVETAYKAVMKPKEGTILTVARGGAERAAELLEENPDIEMKALMEAVVSRSEEVLAQTPEMLPVLKEAGVVDSGGQGLLQILKGAFDAFNGIDTLKNDAPQTEQPSEPAAASAAEESIRFLYHTEFVITPEAEFTDDTARKLQSYLEAIGDSVVLSNDNGKIAVQVHTNDPGHALQRALKLGILTDIRIFHLRLETPKTASNTSNKTMDAGTGNARSEAEPDPFALPDMPKLVDLKDVGFISVSIGEGIADIFRELGVDCLIEGGQTMNPSTEDMLNAIGQVPARNIFILPNNKNIILAANQAKAMTKDKNIFVIPTKTVPQGITALISYVPEKSPEENAMVMELEIENVKTGQITYAVRDTHIEK